MGVSVRERGPGGGGVVGGGLAGWRRSGFDSRQPTGTRRGFLTLSRKCVTIQTGRAQAREQIGETVETGQDRPAVIAAVREWWNPAGHLVCSARVFDPATSRVAVIHPDGHGQEAVVHEARRVLDLPVGQRFWFDTVRVARRRDLHTATITAGSVSTLTGVTG